LVGKDEQVTENGPGRRDGGAEDKPPEERSVVIGVPPYVETSTARKLLSRPVVPPAAGGPGMEGVNLLLPSSHSQCGAALVEYALLIALLALVAVPAVRDTTSEVVLTFNKATVMSGEVVVPCVTTFPIHLPAGCTP